MFGINHANYAFWQSWHLANIVFSVSVLNVERGQVGSWQTVGKKGFVWTSFFYLLMSSSLVILFDSDTGLMMLLGTFWQLAFQCHHHLWFSSILDTWYTLPSVYQTSSNESKHLALKLNFSNQFCLVWVWLLLEMITRTQNESCGKLSWQVFVWLCDFQTPAPLW